MAEWTGILVLAAMAYLLGLENGVSTKGGTLKCRWAGHRLMQGVPADKIAHLHMSLYCLRCGVTITSVNKPAAARASEKGE